MSAGRTFSEGCATAFAPGKVQTAEGELQVDVPQVREAAEPFVSKLFPRGTKLLRTEPLRAMVIGAFVRGLSMRDVESLCEQAGLGKLSKSTASRICQELRERFEQFRRRDLYDLQLAALFLDAVFLSVRPDGPKEGVLVAWGFTEEGERVLLWVMLGMRESHEDWLELGRDLIARGLGAPLLVVADGAPGLIKAIEQCWPASHRQHCAFTACATCWPSCPNGSASASARPTGRRSTTPPASTTASTGSRRWSTRSTRPATPPPPNASPTTSRRSSCTCATRPGTGAGGGAPTCSSDHSARSSAAPRSSADSPARPAASRSSGPFSIDITHATNGVSFTQLERQRLRRLRYQGHDETTPRS
jgi:Transposase, Mutator family